MVPENKNMKNEEMPENVEYIPNNVLNKGKFLGFDWIRWVEFIVLTASVCLIVWSTTLLQKIKIIICVVIGISILVVCLHGIKNRSITEFLIDASRDRTVRKKYSLASIDVNRKGFIKKQGEFGNISNMDKIIKKIKGLAKSVDEKYDPQK